MNKIALREVMPVFNIRLLVNFFDQAAPADTFQRLRRACQEAK